MRFLIALLACVACIAMAPAAARSAEKVDLTGEWQITIETPNGTFTPTAILQQQGEKLTGTYKGRMGESKLEGSVKEKAVKWEVTVHVQDQDLKLAYSGTVESNDTMKGSVQFGDSGSAQWTAKRKAKEK